MNKNRLGKLYIMMGSNIFSNREFEVCMEEVEKILSKVNSNTYSSPICEDEDCAYHICGCGSCAGDV